MSAGNSLLPHAPVAVFAYERPVHLERTLKSLLACELIDTTPVTIFIDGPRKPENKAAVKAVHQIACKLMGERADIRLHEANRGLSASIIAGVNELLDKHGRVIVVEDDLDLAPVFLRFMNAALERYQSEESVYQVSGHMFDATGLCDKDALVLPLTTTWGWATWARAWSAYDPKAEGWDQMLRDPKLRKRFDLNGSYPFSWLMQRQARGLSDSWGIRWYWSVFRRGGVGIFPPKTLVRNHGQDGSGTHGGGVVANFSKNCALLESVPALPDEIKIEEQVLAAVSDAVWKEAGGWRGWALHRLRRLTEN